MKNSRIVLNGQNYATPHTESVEIVMSHSVLAGSAVVDVAGLNNFSANRGNWN